MKYCVYLTVYFGDDASIPRRYIGSTSIARIKKGYKGSVKSKMFKNIFKKVKDQCRTRILSVHEEHYDSLGEELRLQVKYDVIKSDRYFNMSYARPNGYFGSSMSGEAHPFYGRTHTSEVKKRLSEHTKRHYKEGKISPFKTLDVKGENNPFYGKTHTEETKEKMRKPKSFVPKRPCPHCGKVYDMGNLKQHLTRIGWKAE